MAKKSTAGPSAKQQERAAKAKESEKDDSGLVDHLLSLEEPTRAAAANYPSGPNSDGVKHALSTAAGGIANIRKALENVVRMTR
jgi:hypothetical protein